MSTYEDEIKATIDRFATAWKTGDGPALARFFTDDGTLINPFGPRAVGSAAVGAMYTEYFGGMLRGTSTSFKLETVRAVESRHALVDGEQTVHAADGSVALVAHVTALMRRDGDTWLFVDSRPYLFANVPG